MSASMEERLQVLRELVAAIHAQDYERVVELSQTTMDETKQSVIVDGKDDPHQFQQLSSNLRRTLVWGLVQCERYEDAVAAAQKFLPAELLQQGNEATAKQQQQYRSDGSSGKVGLQSLLLYALYKQKQYTPVIEWIQTNKQAIHQQQQQPNDINRLFHQLLMAQSQFHAADGPGAWWAYLDLLQNNLTTKSDTDSDDIRIQVWTNAMAVGMAHFATPYCHNSPTSADNASSVGFVELMSNVGEYLKNTVAGFDDKDNASTTSNTNDYPYDLAYNLATWNLVTASSIADRQIPLRLLETAARACRAATEGDPDEVGPIETNQSLFAHAFGSMTTRKDLKTSTTATLSANRQRLVADKQEASTAATPISTAWQTVRQINRALALPDPEEALVALTAAETGGRVSSSSLTGLQQRIYWYNQAVLQLEASQCDTCRRTCQTYFGLSSAKNGRKNKTVDGRAVAEYATPEDRIFWEGRITVLLAHCEAREKTDSQTEGSSSLLLDAVVDQCRALNPSSARDHILTYVLLHRANLQSISSSSSTAESNKFKEENLKQLEDLPEQLASKPAVVATKASIYQSLGQEEKAKELLLTTAKSTMALADFAMSQGNYKEATLRYEKEVANTRDDLTAVARWVRALSFTDPKKAIEIWQDRAANVCETDVDNEENGAELEARELPRLTVSSQKGTGEAGLSAVKPKKSREAILRRRARQRDAYLTEQEKKGIYKPGSLPDPERWVPKYERANARRRRKNRGGGGAGGHSSLAHQGGVSEKDAAKLDVVARQAARAAIGDVVDPSNRSTAHMTVSGGASNTRKGKSSKRK